MARSLSAASPGLRQGLLLRPGAPSGARVQVGGASYGTVHHGTDGRRHGARRARADEG